MKQFLFIVCAVLFLALPGAAQDNAAGPTATVVLSDLSNPSGVAIQPETGVVFVSDSGAGKVLKVVGGKAEPVITDFKLDVYGKGPMYNIGPLGLLFLDRNTLVVGGGDLPDGEELLRVFDLSAGNTLKPDSAKASFALPGKDDIKPEGNFYALAATPTAVYVTSNGDDTKGWVARATRNANTLSGFERFLATKEAVEVDAPVGITISPRGEIVVGQMGEVNVANDSLVTFYDAQTKKVMLNLKTQLYDITSIAYSPRGQMYALDFAWMDAAQGGLFQLLREQGSDMRTKKILSLDKPSAMAFAPDGSLFVTTFGAGEKKGQLLKIAPGL